ncbi:MAG: hypothetical protein DKT66_13885 [Candidatus Melainabacteria bacterium]|nr:MAG: hypothetical protein DKT66_13885 [Candidatus Melainabacteria bacterium]
MEYESINSSLMGVPQETASFDTSTQRENGQTVLNPDETMPDFFSKIQLTWFSFLGSGHNSINYRLLKVSSPIKNSRNAKRANFSPNAALER